MLKCSSNPKTAASDSHGAVRDIAQLAQFTAGLQHTPVLRRSLSPPTVLLRATLNAQRERGRRRVRGWGIYMRRVRAAVKSALASPREARNATAALLRREIHCALLVSPSRSPLCSSRELQHRSCSCAQPQSPPPCDREAAVGSVAHADFSGRGLISTQCQSRAGGSLADTPICRSDAPSDRAARARWFCWAQRHGTSLCSRCPSSPVSMRDRLNLSAIALTLLRRRDRLHAPLISRRRDATPTLLAG